MLFTVFTPTYNRGHLLPRLYRSLKEQTFSDFEWLIVDDGSIDNTEVIVSEIILKQNNTVDEQLFPVRYIKKDNGGKHTAVNRGVKEAKGELFFIADSDDMLPINALGKVARVFKEIKGNGEYAGVAGLDCFPDGTIVGNGLPQDIIRCNAMDIRYKYHVTGDLKEVFRTEILKKYSFPEVAGEKFCPEQVVWFRIAQRYKLLYFNDPIYIADYQAGGITASIVRARMNSPIASMMCYAEITRYNVPIKEKVKAAINFFRFKNCLKRDSLKGNKELIYDLSFLWYWAKPFGFLLHLNDLRK